MTVFSVFSLSFSFFFVNYFILGFLFRNFFSLASSLFHFCLFPYLFISFVFLIIRALQSISLENSEQYLIFLQGCIMSSNHQRSRLIIGFMYRFIIRLATREPAVEIKDILKTYHCDHPNMSSKLSSNVLIGLEKKNVFYSALITNV